LNTQAVGAASSDSREDGQLNKTVVVVDMALSVIPNNWQDFQKYFMQVFHDPVV